eukprot:517932_1
MAQTDEKTENVKYNDNINDEAQTVWFLIKGFTEENKYPAMVHIPKDDYNKRQKEFLDVAVRKLDWLYKSTKINEIKSRIEEWMKLQKKSEFQENQQAYYLPGLKGDIDKILTKIKQTNTHDWYMNIDIGYDPDTFDNEGLQSLIEKSYNKITKLNSNLKRLIIYFTGHGQCKTGNWIINRDIKNKSMTLENIISCFPNGNNNIQIIILSDCCFAGNWVEKWIKYSQNKNDSICNNGIIYGASISQNYGFPYARDEVFRTWMCGKDGVYCSKNSQQQIMEIFASQSSVQNQTEDIFHKAIDLSEANTVAVNNTIQATDIWQIQ